MKTNWTTKSGKKVELETINNNGYRESTTVTVDGIEHKAGIEKVNGTWAVKMMDNGMFLSLSAEIFAQIEADREASRKPMTAEQINEMNRRAEISKYEMLMKKYEDTNPVEYIKAREAWLEAIKK
jgi:hypothetical protein